MKMGLAYNVLVQANEMTSVVELSASDFDESQENENEIEDDDKIDNSIFFPVLEPFFMTKIKVVNNINMSTSAYLEQQTPPPEV